MMTFSDMFLSCVTLALLLMCPAALCGRSRRVHDEEKLYKQILTDYISSVRPMVNGSGPLEVSFSIRLNQIVQLDERQQVLTTNVFIDQTWIDPALSWNPDEFRDVRSLTIPEEKVWKPDTFLYNNADNASTGFISGNYIQIRHTGAVTWPASVRLQSSCVVKITYFPFDFQFCTLRFGSWIYSQPLVDFTVQPNMVSVDTSSYINNSQWELLDMKMDKSLTNRSRASAAHPHLTVVIYLKRNTFYYLFNIIVPCVMLSVLTLMTFWLPPTSGEKVTLGLSVFLAFSMFMLLIAEEVPASSDAVPIIGIYLCVVMTMTSLSVIFAVTVTNLHSRGSKLRSAPRWLSKLCVQYLAYFLGVSQDVQLLASTTCLSDACRYFILYDHGLHSYQTNKAVVRAGQSKPRQNRFQGEEIDQFDDSSNSHDEAQNPLRSSNESFDPSATPMIHVTQCPEQISIAQHSRPINTNRSNGHRTNKKDKSCLTSASNLNQQTPGRSSESPSPSGADNPMLPDSDTTALCHDNSGTDDFVFHRESSQSKDPNVSNLPTNADLSQSENTPTSLSDISLTQSLSTNPSHHSSVNSFSSNHVHPQTHCSPSPLGHPDVVGKGSCNCCNNEQVWVLREDVAAQNQSNRGGSSPATHVCSSSPGSRTRTLQAQGQGQGQQPQQRWRNVNGRPVTPYRSGKIWSQSRDAKKYRQTEREKAKIEKRKQEVLKDARYMIAEWCTIAQVIDRLLFILSLLLTLFAYVFILVVLPAGHEPKTDNSTFLNSLKATHYVQSS